MVFIDLSQDDTEDTYDPTTRSGLAAPVPVVGANGLPSPVLGYQLKTEHEEIPRQLWITDNSSMPMTAPSQWHQPVSHQPEFNTYYPPTQTPALPSQANLAPARTNYSSIPQQNILEQFDHCDLQGPLDSMDEPVPVQGPFECLSFTPTPQMAQGQLPNVQFEAYAGRKSHNAVKEMEGRPNCMKRSYAAMSGCADTPVYTASALPTGAASCSPAPTQVSSVASVASNSSVTDATYSHSGTASCQSVSPDPLSRPQLPSVKATANKSTALRWKVDTRVWSSNPMPPNQNPIRAPSVRCTGLPKLPANPAASSYTASVQAPPQLSSFEGKVRPPIGHKSSCEDCNVSFIVTEYSKPALDGEGLLCNFCGSKPKKLKQVGHANLGLTAEGSREPEQHHASNSSAIKTDTHKGSNQSNHKENNTILAINKDQYTMEVDSSRRCAPKHRARVERLEEQLETRSEKLPPSIARCKIHGDPACTEESCVDDFFTEYNPFDESLELKRFLEKSSTPFVQGPRRPPVAPTERVNALGESERKLLQDQQLAVSLAARSQNEMNARRPYLSLPARRFLRHMGTWKGFVVYDNAIIHVDFTACEMETVRKQFKSCSRKPGLEKLRQNIDKNRPEWQIGALVNESLTGNLGEEHESLEQMRQILHLLPGRTLSDCGHFLRDCRQMFLDGQPFPRDASIIKVVLQPKSRTKSSNTMLRLHRELGIGRTPLESSQEIIHEMRNRSFHTLFPYKQFKEGSSDIDDICWDPNGERFAIGSIAPKDAYNRPGNLMLGSAKTCKIKMLNGHKEIRPLEEQSAVLDDEIYSTVSSVRFSLTGEYMYSASYDKTVKVWQARDGQLINTIRLPGKSTVMERSPVIDGAWIAGCDNGDTMLARMSNGHLKTNIMKSPAEKLYPSALLWGNEARPNYIIAGYDNSLKDSPLGNLVIFDANVGKLLKSIVPGSTRHFDIAINPDSNYFVTAAVGKNTTAKSLIRVYHLADGGAKYTNIKCESHQTDINNVTISPCSQYVTSSATDGTTVVWDIRKADEYVSCLKHGPSLVPPPADGTPLEEFDTGTMWTSWGPTTDRIFTGGSDGCIKIWNVKSGNTFIQNICKLDTQIMTAAFSPNYDQLLVGETSGNATLFSAMGNEREGPGLFDVDIRDMRAGKEDRVAAEAAREFIRAGKMVVIDGIAWATGS